MNKHILRIMLSGTLFLTLLFTFSACSSPPKRADEIFVDRNTAVSQLNLANHNVNRGRYEDALIILEDAWRLVLGTDDPALRIQTITSRGSIYFYLGRHKEAFSAWESAAAEGDASGLPALAALARIYSLRAKVVNIANSGLKGEELDTEVSELLGLIHAEMPIVRNDTLATAAGLVTLGLAEKQLRRWTEAENYVRSALATHQKDRYLEDAAYDWFLIASIRSRAENYDSALEALRLAISFDRRAENGFGLASSWQAMGDIHTKAGNREDALAAYRRSADIYRAIGLLQMAGNLEALL